MIKTQLLHPKFILLWILINFLRLFVFIPITIQFKIARIIAKIIKFSSKNKIKIAQINIDKCFVNLDNKAKNELLNNHLNYLAMSLFDTINGLYMNNKKIKTIYKINNQYILQNAIDANKNIIILATHFTSLPAILRILISNFDVAFVYRPPNNLLFRHIMVKQSIQHSNKMIETKNIKKIIKTLKNKIPILYAPDQDLKSNNSIFAPFFNISTNTVTATSKLAKITNAIVIPLEFQYNNGYYMLNFNDAISNFPSDDILNDTTRINKIIEQQIQKAPEQYFWMHRRFKTRPAGEEDFYK